MAVNFSNQYDKLFALKASMLNLLYILNIKGIFLRIKSIGAIDPLLYASLSRKINSSAFKSLKSLTAFNASPTYVCFLNLPDLKKEK